VFITALIVAFTYVVLFVLCIYTQWLAINRILLICLQFASRVRPFLCNYDATQLAAASGRCKVGRSINRRPPEDGRSVAERERQVSGYYNRLLADIGIRSPGEQGMLMFWHPLRQILPNSAAKFVKFLGTIISKYLPRPVGIVVLTDNTSIVLFDNVRWNSAFIVSSLRSHDSSTCLRLISDQPPGGSCV